MTSIVKTPTFASKPHFYTPEGSGIAQYETYRIQPHSKPVVDYFFPKVAGFYHYGEGHPMKPMRLTLTNSLVVGYGLHNSIDHFYDPRPATREELEAFHDSDYIEFLSKLNPLTGPVLFERHREMINSLDDCPAFDGLLDFCKSYTGASLMAAKRLVHENCDIAINWTGGLHHAKRRAASGFCYVNDIVLAIQELLRHFARVLYIDIDIHHGDGVEEAFYNSNRVMTVSFHKYTGEFFPTTGKLDDNGAGLGKHFCLNVPLKDGIDDESYVTLFRAVMEPTITNFRPSSIVLQCGADSLGCDRLGAFNLSIRAHGECVRFIKSFDIPLLILGGGGYTVPNVARCWAYETSVLLGVQVPATLPHTLYDEYFMGDKRLHLPNNRVVENKNTRASLERIRISIREKLRFLDSAPSVQLQAFPPDLSGWLEDAERKEVREMRRGAEDTREDNSKHFAEYYDPDGDGERNRFFEGPPTSSSVTFEREPMPARTVSTRKVAKKPALNKGKGKAREEGNRVTFAPGFADPAEEKTPARGRKVAGAGRAKKSAKAKGKEKEKVPEPPPTPSREADLDI